MSNMRIGGLASGIDTDKIISDLMKAERMPLQKMEQDRTWLTWQRDAYREMNTLFLNFRSQLTDMKMSDMYRSRVTSTTNEDLVTSSATSAASQSSYTISEVTQMASAATKVNNASIFNDPSSIDTSKSLSELQSEFASNSFDWKQGSVKQESISAKTETNQFSLVLQDGVKINNVDEMSIKVGSNYYTAVDSTQKSADDLLENEVLVDTSTGDLTFKNNLSKGAEVKVKYTTDFQVDIMSTSKAGTKIKLSNEQIVQDNIALTIGDNEYIADGTNIVKKDDNSIVVGTIDYETGTITMNDDNTIPAETNVSVKYQYDYINFRAGAHTKDGFKDEVFNIKGSQSFNSLLSEVNQADNGVSMFYDEMTGQMSLTRTETGNFNGSIDNSDVSTDDASNQEIITSGSFINEQMGFDLAQETGGTNAEFTLNGLTTSRSSNSFTVSGVTFNLKQTFSNQNVTVNVSNDSEAVFENIKGFVEKYNELIGKVQDKLQEDRYRDYKPLTDKQREELSDRQQELWEEKAKSGLLRSDSTLSGALNNMRRDFYTSVENSDVPSMYQQLSSIGITTTANYLEGGKLEINESKLKEAIQDDPKAIEDLFTSDGASYDQKGILQRMTDSVNQVMDRVTEKAGNTFKTEDQYSMGKRLDDMDDRIEAFEDRLIQVEDRYWRQFTEMEKAIQRMNSQSTYLMQQFGGGM
ncbi:flagellar filament capping protein FliD [Virgibacillus ndiopensis]|uniref:flagellar filament capping protein FliD n=1 Tax=Virgibacillus ndiopensis TaxID=2004408 RepID=UPI001FE931B7|nr:flagellar filament capping protein FliD [Virgibacillus ndiopensis]